MLQLSISGPCLRSGLSVLPEVVTFETIREESRDSDTSNINCLASLIFMRNKDVLLVSCIPNVAERLEAPELWTEMPWADCSEFTASKGLSEAVEPRDDDCLVARLRLH